LSWFYLSLAILFEVSGTISVKLSHGFSKLIPSILMFVFYGLSLSSLSLALKNIEVGVAYAIWSGVGITIIVIIGVLFFNESISILKVVSIVLIIVGICVLNLSDKIEKIIK
jgi:small multidrug resistance pump